MIRKWVYIWKINKSRINVSREVKINTHSWNKVEFYCNHKSFYTEWCFTSILLDVWNISCVRHLLKTKCWAAIFFMLGLSSPWITRITRVPQSTDIDLIGMLLKDSIRCQCLAMTTDMLYNVVHNISFDFSFYWGITAYMLSICSEELRLYFVFTSSFVITCHTSYCFSYHMKRHLSVTF